MIACDNVAGSRQPWLEIGAALALWASATVVVLATGHADPAISPLLLLAPLVLVPLAGRTPDHLLYTSPVDAAGFMQRLKLLASVALVAAFAVPSGAIAASLATGWVAVTGLHAGAALRRCREQPRWQVPAICSLAAALSLPVGGAWIVFSRGGVSPLGFTEPIVLLTAVHFHYSGFVTATLFALAWPHVAQGGKLRTASAAVIVMAGLCSPPLVAAGFVLSPALKLAAVAAFCVALCGFALLVLTRRQGLAPPRAEALFRVAALSIATSMPLALAYELGEFSAAFTLPVPLMVATHGLLNVIGFSGCGLLAFHLTNSRAREE